jgi:hypothetical protein
MLPRRPMPFWIAGRNAAPVKLCLQSIPGSCLQRITSPLALNIQPISGRLPLAGAPIDAVVRHSSGYPPA